MGVLYLVGTPIGNLDDISLRALNVLREVTLVLAEDTRTTRRLFDRHGIRTRLQSYTEHSHAARVHGILEVLAASDIALVSEAGMPGINDPGQALVAAAVAAGFFVTAIPGASAVPAAVALAGFPISSFIYLGFLPHAGGDRRRVLAESGPTGHAIVCFEAPHRLRAALADVVSILGDRDVAVCRELTKLYEEVFRGTAPEALAHFTEPRGEFTLVIRGRIAGAATSADELAKFLMLRRQADDSARDAVAAAVARFGIGRRAAYEAWEALAGSGGG